MSNYPCQPRRYVFFSSIIRRNFENKIACHQ
nr:unnamed protein product [Callosobruchus analis]